MRMRRACARPRRVRTLTLFAVAIVSCVSLLASAACGRRSAANAAAPRVIVLGFDGLDYALTQRLMAEGRLPNFTRLARAGGFSPLATTMPPQSPVAWSTFTTGLDPAAHGIYDFVHRDPATLAPYLSTTRTDPPRWVLPLGPWQLPLRGGAVVPLRAGEPFWARLEQAGIETSILRMPANYPPSGQATRELSGMGTPDLLGSYGTFTLFTSDPAAPPERAVAGGRIIRVRVVDDVARGTLEGPDNPLRRTPQKVGAPIVIYRDPRAQAVRVTIGDEARLLTVGEWSDWTPVTFALAPLQSLHGMVRFHLKAVRPRLELYVTPIEIDPLQPALPISTPSGYAAELARATGRFYTQGMPEDTKALSAGVFDADEFLRQAALTAEENRRQYVDVLRAYRGGLLFYYFGHVDQVSHMMWRATDPSHPAYDAARDAPHAQVVENLYIGLDAIVGHTLDHMPPETLLVVMSDHGFASWRRSFHLNAWLEQQGYLTVRDPARRHEPMFRNVDWTRTRAYGLGLNGLYLNLKGREPGGIVEPAQREALVAEIGAALLNATDPSNGARAVTAVFRPGKVGSAVAHPDRAPDLIVGYAKGTRCSNESALGEVPAVTMADNMEAWSGDHCMDPASVPGVLFTSRPLRTPAHSLQDLSGALLTEFGVRLDAGAAH